MLINVLFSVALLLTIVLPLVVYFVGEQSKGRFKRTVLTNCLTFFGTFLLGTIVIFSNTASAAVTSDAASSNGFMSYCCQVLQLVFHVSVLVTQLQAQLVQLLEH